MPAGKMIDMFTVKVESELNIDQIASQVEAACVKHNFALLQSYNYHQIVETKGFPINRKAWVYNICQAKTASMMLTSNPEFSIFMPCTLALYEDQGKTVISTMNMGIMLRAVRRNKAFYTEASSLFKKLTAMMDSLAVK